MRLRVSGTLSKRGINVYIVGVYENLENEDLTTDNGLLA